MVPSNKFYCLLGPRYWGPRWIGSDFRGLAVYIIIKISYSFQYSLSHSRQGNLKIRSTISLKSLIFHKEIESKWEERTPMYNISLWAITHASELPLSGSHTPTPLYKLVIPYGFWHSFVFLNTWGEWRSPFDVFKNLSSIINRLACFYLSNWFLW